MQHLSVSLTITTKTALSKTQRYTNSKQALLVTATTVSHNNNSNNICNNNNNTVDGTTGETNTSPA